MMSVSYEANTAMSVMRQNLLSTQLGEKV